ncbi:MAG: GNAT family N-acetyltransferase [Planctomycetes bacterium]|nr:GNAT family N-acetyltransferase [Planctomycetota bacterium]
MDIRLAGPDDIPALLELRQRMYSDETIDEHLLHLHREINNHRMGDYPADVFIAVEEGRMLGFIEVGFRSRAEGCDPNESVGFIETWYVVPERQGNGVGHKLVSAAENWARAHGRREMASIVWQHAERSQRAHEAMGYSMVDRFVNYRKAL